MPNYSIYWFLLFMSICDGLPWIVWDIGRFFEGQPYVTVSAKALHVNIK